MEKETRYACNERCPDYRGTNIEGIGICECLTNWKKKDVYLVKYEPDDSKGGCY